MEYCALCGLEHDIGECCGGPKDIDVTREFFLNIIDAFSSGDEKFAREAEIFKDFVLEVEPEKIPAIYRELLVGLAQSFKKATAKDGSPIIERLTCDRFS